MPPDQIALAICLFLGAILYTSVGHGGASAYIAIMALFSVPAATMRPTALVLNILVASFTSFRYVRAGLFRWRTLWPIIIGSIPLAFVGGAIQLPGAFYRPLVGFVLVIAAARLLWGGEINGGRELRDPPVPLGIAIGAFIGLLSGLTGTGGGIFLSPIVLFLGWCEPRKASGVAAVFILCNSVAGLLGNFSAVLSLPSQLPFYASAVLLGAVIGTAFGVRFSNPLVLKALGVVLVIAGAKLVGVY